MHLVWGRESWHVCFSCIRLFILHALISVLFLFLLVLGVGCGLWLWHSLDFSINYFIRNESCWTSFTLWMKVLSFVILLKWVWKLQLSFVYDPYELQQVIIPDCKKPACVLTGEPPFDKSKWHMRPANTQISIRPIWSESSLCAQWVAKEPIFLHADSEDYDETGRMPRLIWVFAGRTKNLLVCREAAQVQNV